MNMMRKEKDVAIAYLLWLFVGIFGAHKLYLARPWMALLYLFTAGLLLIGWLIDLFTLKDQVLEFNEAIYANPEYEDDREFLEDRIDDLEDEVDYLKEQLRRRP